jgi:hypothetical protein
MCYEEEPRALAEVRRQCQWAGCGVTVARWLRRLGGCCGACARNCLRTLRRLVLLGLASTSWLRLLAAAMLAAMRCWLLLLRCGQQAGRQTDAAWLAAGWLCVLRLRVLDLAISSTVTALADAAAIAWCMQEVTAHGACHYTMRGFYCCTCCVQVPGTAVYEYRRTVPGTRIENRTSCTGTVDLARSSTTVLRAQYTSTSYRYVPTRTCMCTCAHMYHYDCCWLVGIPSYSNTT